MLMKNKILTKLICALSVCLLLFSAAPVSVEANTNTVGEAKSLMDGIVEFKLNESGASSVQNWISGSLTANAGVSSEWYILALSQSGRYDFLTYQTALKAYLNNNKVNSASSRQKYALAFIATGSADTYISDVMENSIGKQGVMSWIYGLHLLNNGYTSSSHTTATAKQKLLSLQLADGGWAVTGSNSEVDATAMAVQALAPHYKSDGTVKNAIDKALALLSARQLDTGDYSNYGVPNPESTAQVITALSALGINGESDSRFIKNGNTLFDGLRKYRLSDGSFCHKEGGSSNGNATVQAFYSLVSYIRMAEGKTGLYILDNRNPSALPEVAPTTPNSSGGNTTTSPDNSEGSITPTPDPNEGNTTTSPDASIGNATPTPDTSGSTTTSPQGSTGAQDLQNETIAEGNTTSQTTQDGNVSATEQDETSEETKHHSYKPWVSLALVVVAGITSLMLYLLKKRNKKNFIAIAIVTVLAIAFVGLTNFQSTDDYYSGKNVNKENVVGTVTLTIRCDTIVGKSDSEYIPSDGIILDTTEFAIEENESVYDILTEAAQKYNIQLENTGAEGMVYIAGINYLYEFAFGDLSGWMYYVNGEEPSVGCDEYILSNGDTIEWLYTCELGKDLE